MIQCQAVQPITHGNTNKWFSTKKNRVWEMELNNFKISYHWITNIAPKNYAKWRRRARWFIICEARTVHLTRLHIAVLVSLCCTLPIVFGRPRQNHTDRGCSSPPHGPQSSMPVPQCQANKSVESDNLSKAHTIQGQGQPRPSL